MPVIEIKKKLLPKQLEFLNSNEKEVLFTGSYASGKSYALCCKLYKQALYPGSFCLLTRKTLSSLKASTLRTLFVGEKDCPPVLIPQSYEYLESKSTVKIYGGGEIFVCGCDDPLRIRSINASCIAVDEAGQLDEVEYLELLSRIRNTASLNRQLFSVTNPSSKNHFLYKRFFEKNNGERKVITSTLFDNHYLSKDYIDQQLKLTGINYRRYVEAEWCNNEGACYPYDPNNYYANKTTNEYTKYVIGLDIGYTNDPTAIIVVGFNNNQVHIFEEYVKNNITPTEIVIKVKELYEKYNNATIAIDPSAAGIRLEIENKLNIKLEKVDNSILLGISRIQELFTQNRITITKGLINFEKELDLYSWDDKKEKPIDKSNHCMDAFRYSIQMINYLTQIHEPTIYVPAYE